MTKSISFFGRSAAALALVGLCTGPLAAPAFAADEEELGLLAFLGLTASTGTTEVKGDAGKLEASLLMAPTLTKAAKEVLSELGKEPAVPTIQPIIPVFGNSTLDMRALAIARMRVDSIEQIDKSITACPIVKAVADPSKGVDVAGAAEAGGGNKSLDTSAQGILSAVTSLLKTDTTYSAIALTPNNEMFLNALAQAGGDRILIPSERIFVSKRKLEGRLITAMASLSNKAATCTKAKESKDQATKTAAETKLAEILKAVALANSLTALGEKGAPSLIEQASLLEFEETEKPLILRVEIATVGGTMVQRKNVLTTLGLDGGIGIRGGVALGWRLIDPETGKMKKGGTIICSSPVANFGNVYEKAKGGAQCTSIVK